MTAEQIELPAFLQVDQFEKPVFQNYNDPTQKPPTEPMKNFAQKLLRTKAIHPDFTEVIEEEIAGWTYDQCHDFLRKMKLQPDRDKSQRPHKVWSRPEIPKGCYLVEVKGKTGALEMWIKVDQKPGETRMYRLQGSPGTLASQRIERVPFLEHLSAVLMVDPVAAQIAFATKLRHCMRCGSPLTNKASRDRNLGPECANK